MYWVTSGCPDSKALGLSGVGAGFSRSHSPHFLVAWSETHAELLQLIPLQCEVGHVSLSYSVHAFLSPGVRCAFGCFRTQQGCPEGQGGAGVVGMYCVGLGHPSWARVEEVCVAPGHPRRDVHLVGGGVDTGCTVSALLLPRVRHALGCSGLPWQQVLRLRVEWALCGSGSG